MNERGGGLPPSTTRYLAITRPCHPLAHADGRVMLHRFVLYAMIGPGDHECHWCQAGPLRWRAARPAMLCVDHVDGDTWNNAPGNLVPACEPCNIARLTRASPTCAAGHPWNDANTYIRPDSGTRICRACQRVRDRRKSPRVR